MPFERSAGAIIIRQEKEKTLFLLLKYSRGSETSNFFWDLPKGHIEKGEKEIDTVKREVAEETGIKDIEFLGGFKEWFKYFFRMEGKLITKIATFYLAETREEHVTLSSEHIGYHWLPYTQAVTTLSFDNSRTVLKKAKNFLETKGYNFKD